MVVALLLLQMNSGFIFARPTKAAVNLYQKALEYSILTKQADQQSLNAIWMKRTISIKVLLLDEKKFLTGEERKHPI